jgi:signal transduction histidine kinase
MNINVYIIISFLASIACLSLGLFVYLKDKVNPINKSFGYVNIVIAVWTSFPFVAGIAATNEDALLWARLVHIAAALTPSIFLHFTFTLLQLNNRQRERNVLIVSYLVSVLFLFSLFSPNFIKDIIRHAPSSAVVPGPLYFPFMLFFTFMCIYSFYCLFVVYRQSQGIKKNQLGYVFAGFGSAYIGGTLYFGAAYFKIEPIPHDIFVILYAAIISYAIIKYRLMNIDVVYKKGAVYSAGLLLILAPAFLIILWAEKFFLGSVNLSLSIVLLSVVAVSAIAFYNLKLRTERALENTLFYKKYNPYKVLSNFTKEMVSVITLDELLNRTINTFVETLKIKKASIFLFDEEKKVYTMKASYSLDEEKNKIKIKQEDSLISHFITKEDVAIREEIERYPSTQQTQEIIKILKEMESEIAIPFLEKGQLTGFCNLGAKGDRSMYSNEDIELFLSLGRQACVAIQNAQLVERIKESKLVIRRIERLKTVGDLAAGFAHEIRNPLVPIKACLQLLPSRYGKDMDFTEKIPRYALQEVERIEKLLREIMDYSRPRTPVFQEEDINEVIENTVQFIEYQAKKKGIKIERGYDNSLPVIKVDREQIKQVLLNLIMNAMDAVNGIGKIEIATRKVRHMLSPCGKIGEGGYVQIEVRDNGTGIANEDLDRIFNPFYTTKHESSDGREGTGLGLSIVQEIVSEHCGFVDVRSEVGVGSSFYVNLPVETAEPKEKTGRRGEDAKIK